MLKNINKIIVAIILFFVSFSVIIANAATTTLIDSSDVKYKTGNYELNDLVQVGVNVSYIILGVVGSLALLMFVYGGLVMLISSGNTEKVSQAKSILVSAVVGLVIVFSSYLIISFVMDTFGVSWDGAIKQ